MNRIRTLGVPLAALCLLLALAVGCGDSCVEESTLVSTPDGPTPIGELEVGDAVISVDPATGAVLTTRVARINTAWAWCEKLEIGQESLWLTAEHPLYSPELSDFRTAEAWLEGELERTLSDTGAEVRTRAGEWFDQRPCRVVDLTVADEPHTFVASGIVMHNKDQDTPCESDEDCGPYVCDPRGFCVEDRGAGSASGAGGAGGEGGASGVGGA